MAREPVVLYWDSSAVLSALFRDRHSAEAIAWSRRQGVHLLTTLAWAEAHAVHLAAAKSLQEDLPELRLLSFDQLLARAARQEGVV